MRTPTMLEVLLLQSLFIQGKNIEKNIENLFQYFFQYLVFHHRKISGKLLRNWISKTGKMDKNTEFFSVFLDERSLIFFFHNFFNIFFLIFIQGCFSAANLTTTVVAKCCDVGQVYYEMSSECGKGSFNITALRYEHMADDYSDDNEIYFDTGAVKAEDCENGSLRCV